MVDWQPTTTQDTRLARDRLYRQIRHFFQARQFLEVDPPLLGRGGSTDVHLHSLRTQVDGDDFYLQTSPEFFMKRLLAAGSGPIYALSKSFRRGEQGRHHNLEFTILEWYQPDFDDRQLMAQVSDFVETVLGEPANQISYRDSFLAATGLNPHHAGPEQLQHYARQELDFKCDGEQRDTCLELIFSHRVQPTLQAATLVYDYPASQAALAQTATNQHGEAIARRFELFYRGVELGNGYAELTDGEEQLHRFQQDNQQRQARGLPAVTIDHKLIAALDAGVPKCAGIAIGVDRLLMVSMGAKTLAEVIDFPMPTV